MTKERLVRSPEAVELMKWLSSQSTERLSRVLMSEDKSYYKPIYEFRIPDGVMRGAGMAADQMVAVDYVTTNRQEFIGVFNQVLSYYDPSFRTNPVQNPYVTTVLSSGQENARDYIQNKYIDTYFDRMVDASEGRVLGVGYALASVISYDLNADGGVFDKQFINMRKAKQQVNSDLIDILKSEARGINFGVLRYVGLTPELKSSIDRWVSDRVALTQARSNARALTAVKSDRKAILGDYRDRYIESSKRMVGSLLKEIERYYAPAYLIEKSYTGTYVDNSGNQQQYLGYRYSLGEMSGHRYDEQFNIVRREDVNVPEEVLILDESMLAASREIVQRWEANKALPGTANKQEAKEIEGAVESGVRTPYAMANSPQVTTPPARQEPPAMRPTRGAAPSWEMVDGNIPQGRVNHAVTLASEVGEQIVSEPKEQAVSEPERQTVETASSVDKREEPVVKEKPKSERDSDVSGLDVNKLPNLPVSDDEAFATAMAFRSGGRFGLRGGQLNQSTSQETTQEVIQEVSQEIGQEFPQQPTQGSVANELLQDEAYQMGLMQDLVQGELGQKPTQEPTNQEQKADDNLDQVLDSLDMLDGLGIDDVSATLLI